jgi:hypothetical protein
VRDVTAGQLKDTDLSAYQDPWTNDVVNASLADIERQRAIQQVGVRNAAAGRGAYDGSRHGVAEAQTNEAAQRVEASTAANLRSQGFLNAQQAAFGDIDRRMTADQGNQGIDYSVAGTNASLAQQAALANAAAANDANRFTAGQTFNADAANAGNAISSAGVRGNAATSLAGLSADQLHDQLTRAGALSAVGDTQGAHDQAGLDAAYQEFVRQQQLQLAAQGMATGALGVVPVGSTTNRTSTDTVTDPMAGVGSLISLASLAAAPFTGGASLAGLGAGQALSTTSPATQSLWKGLL